MSIFCQQDCDWPTEHIIYHGYPWRRSNWAARDVDIGGSCWQLFFWKRRLAPGLCIWTMHATILLKSLKVPQSHNSITAGKRSKEEKEINVQYHNRYDTVKDKLPIDSYPVVRPRGVRAWGPKQCITLVGKGVDSQCDVKTEFWIQVHLLLECKLFVTCYFHTELMSSSILLNQGWLCNNDLYFIYSRQWFFSTHKPQWWHLLPPKSLSAAPWM